MQKIVFPALAVVFAATGAILIAASPASMHADPIEVQGPEVPNMSVLPVAPAEHDPREPNVFGLVEPVDEFHERILLRPFGLFTTPETSPIPNDRFTGWHTAADVEFTDVVDEVPVYAIANGVVIVSRRASGYGGVTVVRHETAQGPLLTLYGHLDPASMHAEGTAVTQGQTLGQLGDTPEENGFTRKHLHFGIIRGETVDLLGYVQHQGDLARWYNPIEFFPQVETEVSP
jgi:murein DD-endopeptidase MepM/ murein hydrolase activator NlpD